ncbi:hypothetical protein M1316_01605 [Candidatus Parvarchaeota archaeon]|nr:hypothetical protein [Candidatus Parvarchaeota archaeon]
MLILKGVLKEELENSKRRYSVFREAFDKLPVGVLVKKKVSGRDYYYLMFREGKKVKFIYKGKNVSQEEIQKYADAKKMRSKYRSFLIDLKKEISFLKKALNGRAMRSVS